MKHLDNLITLLKEFKLVAHELQRKYDSVSQILIFPSIKNLLADLKVFKKSKYLDYIHNRNYQKLIIQLSQYIKEIKAYSKQLDIFLKSTKDYITNKYDKSVTAAKKSGRYISRKFSNYFTFDACLNVYDIFLNVNYANTPALLYQNVLNEKLKRRRLRIDELNAEIVKTQLENGTKAFIEFLRKYDPYNKRLQIQREIKSTTELPTVIMRHEIHFSGQSPKEQLISLINKKLAEMKNFGTEIVSKRILINYLEYTGYVAELLKMEKRENLQKLCNDEFYIVKAKKFVSILFEDNKKENERLLVDLEELKKSNLRIRMDIERFKHKFMAAIN